MALGSSAYVQQSSIALLLKMEHQLYVATADALYTSLNTS